MKAELVAKIAEHVSFDDEGKTWWYHRGWVFLQPFICMGCAKIVDARQWGFSRSCGPCDLGKSRTRRLLMGKCFAGTRIQVGNAQDIGFIPEDHFVPPEDVDKYPVQKTDKEKV